MLAVCHAPCHAAKPLVELKEISEASAEGVTNVSLLPGSVAPPTAQSPG